jgi:outer membrane protein assembly factor BamE (lipoprotein component of BamABCDE complex)
VDKERKREIVGITASIVLVLAVIAIGWRVYMQVRGQKKAVEFFEKAGLPQEKLAQIKIGMTKDQVLKITGEPLMKSTYADKVTDRWDWITVIVEFRDGKVVYAGSSRKRVVNPGASGQNAPPPGPGG